MTNHEFNDTRVAQMRANIQDKQDARRMDREDDEVISMVRNHRIKSIQAQMVYEPEFTHEYAASKKAFVCWVAVIIGCLTLVFTLLGLGVL